MRSIGVTPHGVRNTKKKLTAFGRDEKGVVLIYLALILLVLGGMTALAVDVGFSYVSRQNMQSAADAAFR